MEPEKIPENKFVSSIETSIEKIGAWSSALNVVLIVAIIVQVVLRYGFGLGLVQLEELQWHLYAVNVVFGLSYCQVTNSHIRLDVLHDKFSRRTKEKIEIIGIFILLMPLIYVIFYHSIDFLYEAVRTGERSDSPMGLCCRWIPKALIPISMILLFLSATARVVKAFSYLKHTKKGA
jgi:TRAP-type mannitol/chloroaromatic compound transport system permease small subunit